MSLQARNAKSVTPNDSTNIVYEDGQVIPCLLYVGSGGDLTVKTQNGGNVTFTNLPDGSFIPVYVTRVLVTGTTASDVLALY